MRSLLALLALALCAHAANAKEVMPSDDESSVGLPVSGMRDEQDASSSNAAPGGAHPLNAQAADSCHHCICFTMPTRYVNGDTLSDGFRQWRVGYQNQSLVWRDSVAVHGPAWGRDPANFAKWRPDAQVKWFRSGYARPGERVCVDSLPPVMSLDWPYWYRAQSKTGVWSDISNPCGPFRNNDW